MKTNPVLDAIRNRRSVRTYDPRPLPADVLATIVEAGTLAPTGMNAQTFHFTVIQDAEKLLELNRLIRTALIRYEGRQLNEDYCCYYDAPVLVIASNEPTRTGGMDCACALQNRDAQNDKRGTTNRIPHDRSGFAECFLQRTHPKFAYENQSRTGRDPQPPERPHL